MNEQTLPQESSQPAQSQINQGTSQQQLKPQINQEVKVQAVQTEDIPNQQTLSQQVPPEQIPPQQGTQPEKKKNGIMWAILIIFLIIAVGLGYYLLVR